jgi:protein-disulfide isomerase
MDASDRRPTAPRRRRILAGLTGAILLAVALVAARGAPAGPALQDDPLAPRTKGSAEAPVTVYEMSDFQCPFCRRHAVESFPIIDREYIETGKVRWVFVNFPIPQLHANAIPAAQVAMCSAQQDAFWPVHDLLFLHQDTWGPLTEPQEFMLSLADSVGIDRSALAACLQSQETLPQIQVDAEGAVRAGATSTPTFYIEGGLLVGAHPVEVFRMVLDSIYDAKQGG